VTERERVPGDVLYDELADWFHLLTAPEDYVEEAALVLGLLRDAVDGPLETLLELGVGGGNLASNLPPELLLTLTDRSEAMLRQSRAINPGAEHIAGDMRTLRLGRVFDAVLVHDAVMYMTTADDLRAAIETAFAHVRPGGAAVFVPDAVRETWQPETDHGGHDGKDGRALRYLEWTFDPDPDDTTFMTDFAILLRDADGATRVVHDRHVEGLFPEATWFGLLRAAGFAAESLRDRWGRALFIARRPAAPPRATDEGHG
jgi:SAM-dependent methyltransferase